MRASLRSPFAAVLAMAALAGAGCAEDEVASPEACGSACGENAICIRTRSTGIAICRCRDDYAGDGYVCDAMAPASACGRCHAQASCVRDLQQKAYCKCNGGYAGDGQEVCSALLDPARCGGCDANATCVPVSGGAPTCGCRQGYVGDGKRCSVPTDCDDQHGGCHVWARCGSGSPPLCTCEYGLVGNGHLCQPPARSHVRLQGTIGAVSKATGQCAGTTNGSQWRFDVPLVFDGTSFKGTATAQVFEVEAEVTILDALAGEIRADVSIHAWNPAGICTGRLDYYFQTSTDGLASPHSPEIPLTIFGDETAWWFSSPIPATHTFTGSMTAVIEI